MRAMLNSVISRLGKLLRIDLRYALSGGFFLGVIQASGALVGFGLTIAFANLVPVETYGAYRYVLAVYGLLALFALPGLDIALLQALSKGYDRELKSGISLKFRFGFVGSIAGFLVAGYEYWSGNETLAFGIAAASLALPLMESLGLYSTVLNSKKLFREWAVIEVVTQLGSAAALVLAMILGGGVFTLITAYFIPLVLIRFCALLYLRRTLRFSQETDTSVRKYGESLTLFQIVTRLGASLDQVVLFHFLGPASVAIFALATAVPNRMQSVFRIVGVLAFPKFANRPAIEIVRALPIKMAWLAAGILFLCIGYVLIAPAVFTYLFPAYLPSLPYSQAVVFFTLSAVTYPMSSYLFMHKKVGANYTIAVASLVCKITSLVIFLPSVGIWGAVIGTLASSAAIIVTSAAILFADRKRLTASVQ